MDHLLARMRRHLNPLVVAFIFTLAMGSLAPLTVQAAHSQTVAYLGFSTDKPFWVKLGNAVRQEASQQGITLIDLTPPAPDDGIQARLLEHAINKKVSGIIIGASNPEALIPMLSQATRRGIPVIAIDTAINHPAIKSLIATDNAKGADMAGDYIVKKTGGKGSVLILGGTRNHPNGEARRNGVTRKAEKAGMHVIFRRADWEDEKAFLITSEELGKENDIRAIFACWDPGIDTASLVAGKKGLLEKLVLVGFDGLERTLDFIREGRVTATIAQDTASMGSTSVKILLEVIAGKDHPRRVLIRPLLVDKDRLPRTNN